MYRNLARTEDSVHLTDWPVVDDAAIADELEREMELARSLVSLGRAARSDAKLGVRQPLSRAIALLHRGEDLRAEVVDQIADELNVKRFEVVSSLEGLLSYRVVPNFRSLGPKLGKQAPRVKELLTSIDGAEVRRAFEDAGSYELSVDGTSVRLEPSDVEIRAEQHEDLALAQDARHAVALDLTLDEDLIAEGIAREVIRSINDLRKTRGFDLSDRISVTIRTSGRVLLAVRRHADWIAGEVLAKSFDVIDEVVRDTDASAIVDGTTVLIEIERISV
jgi:isoleucyl-tRNA synthetase